MRTFFSWLESALPDDPPDDDPYAQWRISRAGDPEPEIQDPDHIIPYGPKRKLPNSFKMTPKRFKRRIKKLGLGDIVRMKAKEARKRQLKGSLARFAFKPTKTMGIPRNEMPQLKDREEFIRWLVQNRVRVTREMITPDSLVRANRELLTAHAQSTMYLAKSYRSIRKNKVYDKYMIITQDNKIFDGNHHWLSYMAIDPHNPVEVYRVHMPFTQLKAFTAEFEGVTYEEHWVPWLNDYVPGLVFAEADPR